MKPSSVASPAQARQTKEQFANPEDYLSYELGKAVQMLPPLYIRLLASSLSLLVFGAIAWAHFSQVDEVAVAQGKLVPASIVRPVRSLGEGTILDVRVKPGDRVEKHDILIERDPALPEAEMNRLEALINLIRQNISRLEAELKGEAATGIELQNQLLAARLQEFEYRRAAALAEAESRQAAINEAQVRLTRLQENLANAQSKLAKTLEIERRIAYLFQQGAVGDLTYLNLQSERISQQDEVMSLDKDIAAQAETIRQAQQNYQAARQLLSQLDSERESAILAELNQRYEELASLEGQLKQAQVQGKLETLRAPIAGTVYNIKANPGPVQAGESLLSILPEGEELIVEANVLNRDIGFIATGMPVKVKVAAFPFQEFGALEAELIEVSPDAITDEELGLVFPVKVQLNQHAIMTPHQEVALLPGMAVTAEIVTRQKSILTFLVEPITRRFSEAFSVR